jgi:hypothetical protein
MASSPTVAGWKYGLLAVTVGMLAVLLVLSGCSSSNSGPANSFAGTYSGDYKTTGIATGNGGWTATVDSSGNIKVTVPSPGFVTLNGSGGVDSTGAENATTQGQGGNGAFTGNWTGKFVTTGGGTTCSGTWTTTTGYSGTWEGSKD